MTNERDGNMPSDTPLLTVEFVTLSTEEKQGYDETKRLVHAIMAKPDGLSEILSAIAGDDDDSFATMRLWAQLAGPPRWMGSRVLVVMLEEQQLRFANFNG